MNKTIKQIIIGMLIGGAIIILSEIIDYLIPGLGIFVLFIALCLLLMGIASKIDEEEANG